MGKHAQGRLSGPIPLNADGRPTTRRPNSYNVAFRCGVEQAEKLRACDDLRRRLTNLACHVTTPIQPVSWGHISHRSHILNNGVCDSELFKAAHEAAYKQIPLDLRDQDTSAISLRNHQERLWYGFASRALVFGPIATVMRYNGFLA